MYKITDKIFISGIREAVDEDFIRNNGITAVLNVSHYPTTQTITNAWCPLEDNAKTTKDDLNQAVFWLRSFVDAGHVVLVHCLAGVSRSPTVVAVYLAQEWKCPWRKAILHIKSCRSIAHTNDALVAIAREVLGE